MTLKTPSNKSGCKVNNRTSSTNLYQITSNICNVLDTGLYAGYLSEIFGKSRAIHSRYLRNENKILLSDKMTFRSSDNNAMNVRESVAL